MKVTNSPDKMMGRARLVWEAEDGRKCWEWSEAPASESAAWRRADSTTTSAPKVS